MNDAAQRAQFETIYAEHAGQVYRFALRLSGSREEAEDLAAESLAEAFRQWEKFRGTATPRSWLFAIVLNRWRMKRRRRRISVVSMEMAEDIASTFQFPNLELAQALAKLPDSLRIAFLLVKGESLTHAEAAKALGIPVGTVYFRVHVAIRKLRAELDPNPRTIAPTIEVTCDPEL